MDDPAQTNQQNTAPLDASSANISKEIEGGIALGEPSPLKEVGTHEVDLPKGVVTVGVSAHPTNIKLPPAVQQLGVRATGQPQASPVAPAVALPLTDDQIAQGIKLGVTSSWRWLAEWGLRKIKQFHRKLSKNHA